ncbi:hypothetical protein KXQ82_07190 [Mucilaginibacter sp. HMF5004]|uniref:hypothetical protein n=1 Tax=Mucilaginibacter rivuli TaxID=2857527 RepID=UPI001C5EBF7A|nr:hypothetical protein [Mucilaginibacter rivuli]MBW4889492.1 hypothetical protein [Mucilaginibacter rivuli]
MRFTLYYTGSILVLIVVTLPTLREYKYAEDWLCTMIVAIFIIIHTIFYVKLVKKGFIL